MKEGGALSPTFIEAPRTLLQLQFPTKLDSIQERPVSIKVQRRKTKKTQSGEKLGEARDEHGLYKIITKA